MKKHMQHLKQNHSALLLMASAALVLAAGLGVSGCEAADDFNSRIACDHYCAKNFSCQDKSPSSDETSTCISNCRKSIEDNCGNDHQKAANNHIEDCVDKSCAEFWTCMVFDAAPECYGFVSQ